MELPGHTSQDVDGNGKVLLMRMASLSMPNVVYVFICCPIDERVWLVNAGRSSWSIQSFKIGS